MNIKDQINQFEEMIVFKLNKFAETLHDNKLGFNRQGRYVMQQIYIRNWTEKEELLHMREICPLPVLKAEEVLGMDILEIIRTLEAGTQITAHDIVKATGFLDNPYRHIGNTPLKKYEEKYGFR